MGRKIQILISKLAFFTRSSDSYFVFSYILLGLHLLFSSTIEFVSANPTGPLHVGHCRGAILGDVLSNLLKFNGHLVTKEYYVNDYGNQIKTFILSVYYRILEIVDKKNFPKDKDLYPGDYIISIAKKLLMKKK